MTPHFRRIREFMQKAGQDTPSRPSIPNAETRILRAKLIVEEALETVEALGVELSLSARGERVALTGDDAAALSFSARDDVNLEGVVDGCADISVVTIGTLVAFGVDDEPILEEVDTANLRKFEEGSYCRDDGKWMKPPDWTPPDILGTIRRQEATAT